MKLFTWPNIYCYILDTYTFWKVESSFILKVENWKYYPLFSPFQLKFKTLFGDLSLCYIYMNLLKLSIYSKNFFPMFSGPFFPFLVYVIPCIISIFSVSVHVTMYTAISINNVGSKLQAYVTRPNGGLGIHWNLHICVDENYKFLFLCVKPECGRNECVCSQESFSIVFLSTLHSFNCKNSS